MHLYGMRTGALKMKAVIFDLFETLITEWGKPKYTTRKIADDLNIDYPTFRKEWSSLHTDMYSGRLSSTTQVYKRILDNLGITRDENLLADVTKRRDSCKKACFENIDPRIIDMLEALKTSGYHIGLISNCSYEEIDGLKDCALYPFFDAVVLSCEIGIVKPDVEIYNYCLKLMCVEYSECFYIGDGGSNELWGAEQAGLTPLKALWFTKNFVKEFDPDKRFPIFYEPIQILSHIISLG